MAVYMLHGGCGKTCWFFTWHFLVSYGRRIEREIKVGHPPYNGGRRGGGPFRGGGRGNPDFRPPNSGASGPPFRGRGRGRDRGRGRAGRRGPASSNPESSAQPPARTAWCEVCKIDCTTDEVLNVHNNGRRHKKNLQKLQRMKSASAGAGAGTVAHQTVVQTEKDETPTSDVAPEVQESVPETETEPDKTDKQMEAGDDNEKLETVKNEVDNQEKKDRTTRKMKRGSRGIRGARGGAKRMRVAGPRIRKEVMPLVCDLCNVKCDTQEVFDRHVAGKKHRSKVKRFEGHQAMYGPTAVQALYPPNPLSQTLGPQPPAAYNGALSSYPVPPPPEAYVPPPYQAQNPNPQLADAPLEFGTQNAAALTG
ncbi:uncharacterized protein LOC143594537 [Bidens hawaiensis]|uniref:uncharacterized protein LOC143594537 n=1 Tax=Bidens hawaiensis TaxID=980011 RepID=UPI00404B5750